MVSKNVRPRPSSEDSENSELPVSSISLQIIAIL